MKKFYLTRQLDSTTVRKNLHTEHIVFCYFDDKAIQVYNWIDNQARWYCIKEIYTVYDARKTWDQYIVDGFKRIEFGNIALHITPLQDVNWIEPTTASNVTPTYTTLAEDAQREMGSILVDSMVSDIEADVLRGAEIIKHATGRRTDKKV